MNTPANILKSYTSHTVVQYIFFGSRLSDIWGRFLILNSRVAIASSAPYLLSLSSSSSKSCQGSGRCCLSPSNCGCNCQNETHSARALVHSTWVWRTNNAGEQHLEAVSQHLQPGDKTLRYLEENCQPEEQFNCSQRICSVTRKQKHLSTMQCNNDDKSSYLFVLWDNK